MNKSITSKEIELAIKKNFPQRQFQAYTASLVNFTVTFKEELIPVLTNSHEGLSQERGGIMSHIILWGQYYPYTKTGESYNKKIKLQTDIPYEYRCKNFQPTTGSNNT